MVRVVGSKGKHEGKLWFKQIPSCISVLYYDSSNAGVAKCSRSTGEVWVNSVLFNKVPDDIKLFILAHEAGHIAQDTTNEFAADKWAFDYYTKQLNANGKPRSLRSAIRALSDLLPLTNGEQETRLMSLLSHALQYDYKVNGNENALNELNEIRKTMNIGLSHNEALMLESQFLGIPIGLAVVNKVTGGAVKNAVKNVRENIAQNQANRQVKKAEKREYKLAKNQAKYDSKTEALLTKYPTVESIAQAQAMGLVSQEDAAKWSAAANGASTSEGGLKTETLIYIAIGLVAVVAVVLIILKKKK